MAEFIYNNPYNTSISHTPFEFNYGYHPKVSFKEIVNLRSRFRYVNKLVKELKKLIEICCQNLFYVQELQNRAHNQRVKSCNYTAGEKV